MDEGQLLWLTMLEQPLKTFFADQQPPVEIITDAKK